MCAHMTMGVISEVMTHDLLRCTITPSESPEAKQASPRAH